MLCLVFYNDAECHYVECRYAECHGAFFRVVCFQKKLIFYSVQGAPLNWLALEVS